MIKSLSGMATKVLVWLRQDMNNTKPWLSDYGNVYWLPAPLDNRTNVERSDGLITIAFIAHVPKVILPILVNQVGRAAKGFAGLEQLEYRKESHKAIGIMHILGERSIELLQDVCLFRILWETVQLGKLAKLLEALQDIGI